MSGSHPLSHFIKPPVGCVEIHAVVGKVRTADFLGAVVLDAFVDISAIALAEEFALSEPGLPVLMSTTPRTMDAIMNAYKLGELSEARELLAAATEMDPENDTLRYFNGVVAVRMEGCGPATTWFTNLPATSAFAAKAEYNVALCALRADDIEQARTVLTKTAGSADVQVAARSRELLDRLTDL